MTTLAPVRSVEQWRDELNGKWQALVDNAVSGFVELGNALIEAKGSLEPGRRHVGGLRMGER